MRLAHLLILAIPTSLVLRTAPATGAADPALKCEASKGKAAGKKALSLLKAVAKNKKSPNPTKYTSAVSKAQSKFTKGFTKAEDKGGCSSAGDATAIEAKIDAHVFDLIAELGQATTTTTSTTTTTVPGLPCCELAGPSCTWIPAALCAGTSGGPGDVCNGDGTCDSGPPTSGNCCQFPFPGCSANLSAPDCSAQGGTVIAGSVCEPTGCTGVPTTTTVTSTTSTTLVLCGAAPTCGGSCPPPNVCEFAIDDPPGGICACIPTPGCGSFSIPSCGGGNCPAGFACVDVTPFGGTGCGCFVQ